MSQLYIQVQTTVAAEGDAQRLAHQVMEKHLAACVQIAPCNSIYRWQERLEQETEFLCTMKTRADLFPALEQLMDEVHPYELPELIALPLVDGSAAYLQWLEQALQSPEKA
ncbi:divalent-cation tolerance protein CutA [Desulfogranum mediterraneum]|uniref:divalent-cation tolerance protein CutA n=1 Tax=Desulfogranum mediterraneum TaxID=160661 RepID=UPI0004211A95|nr:divalent-cation tolerance protein CutA [Desulfogranum mediterraneum]